MARISIPYPIVDGVSTPAEEIVLSDPTGAYGVRDKVTLAIIVDVNTPALDDPINKVYYYDFEAEENALYQGWFKLTQDGYTYYAEVIVDTGEGQPHGRAVRFCVARNGALIQPATPPVLASQADTYGLRRIDDSTILVPAGEVMQLLGNGLYETSFFDPEETDKYRFYVKTTVDGKQYVIPGNTNRAPGSMLAIGRYTTSWDIGQAFGHDNIHLWLATPMGDNDDPVDYAMRALYYIERAENQIDVALQGPFVKGQWEVIDDFVIPLDIIECATQLAGVLMYEARGIDDVNPEAIEPSHRLTRVRTWVNNKLKRIRMGLDVVVGSASLDPIRVPFVVSERIGYDACSCDDDRPSYG